MTVAFQRAHVANEDKDNGGGGEEKVRQVTLL